MDNIKMIVDRQREFFASGATRDLAFRYEKLRVLQECVAKYQDEILEALNKDLNKAPFESYMTEVGFVLQELSHTMKHLSKWARPKRVRTPFTHFISSSFIYPEPYGVSLIMAPWNYPFQLVMVPLIASMAAGNCAIVKPSEYSPNTSEVVAKIIGDHFDKSYVSVILGEREVSQDLLKEKFDYIFFTGSALVGKAVMEAAAKHLVPVTLELGGKSPCIVDQKVDIELAARRIVWGKFLNAGQTCVAPDYLLVHRSIKEDLLSYMVKYIKIFYGENPNANPDYPKIINELHFRRLLGLMENGRVIVGGHCEESTLHISPTIVDEISWEDPIMQEEIFGPLLPVMAYDDLSEVISMVNAHPKPLALYFFSKNKVRQKIILSRVSFGGGCINDTIVHLATPYMPFGGIGQSGMGSYHGKAGFDTFSHKKSVLKKSNLIDVPLRYPPYRNKLKILKKIMR